MISPQGQHAIVGAQSTMVELPTRREGCLTFGYQLALRQGLA